MGTELTKRLTERGRGTVKVGGVLKYKYLNPMLLVVFIEFFLLQ